MKLFLPLFFLFFSSACFAQGTYTVSTCERDDVNAAINNTTPFTMGSPQHMAVNGDTILVPAGTCTWTAGIIVPTGIGISIIMAGTDDPHNPIGSGVTTIVDDFTGTYLFYATPNSTASLMRISSFKVTPMPGFSQGQLHAPFAFHGTCATTTAPALPVCPHIRLDHITFPAEPSWGGLTLNGTDAASMVITDGVFGVLDHNSLYQDQTVNVMQFVNFNLTNWRNDSGGDYGDRSWVDDDYWGTELALYVESNYVEESGNGGLLFPVTETEATIDGRIGGGRVVCRFNTFVGLRSMCANHGTESGGRKRSGRSMEFYRNTISCTGDTGPCASAPAGANSFQGGPVPRGGSLYVFANTYKDKVTQSFAQVTNFRDLHSFSPWGSCSGGGSWDHNSNIDYFVGTITGISGCSVSTDVCTITVQDSMMMDPGWTTTQWVQSGSGVPPYRFEDTMTHDGGPISDIGGSNFINVSHSSGFGSGMAVNIGDPMRMTSALSCIDMSGRIGGSLLSGSPATPTNGDVGWTNQVRDVMYEAGDTDDQGDPTVHPFSTSFQYNTWSDLDYFSEVSMTANSCTGHMPNTGCSPFDGSTGTGYGTLTNMPSTCSKDGTGYWAIDSGTWNQSGSGDQGQLYTCQSGIFALYYTPLTYPHPDIMDLADTLVFTTQPTNTVSGSNFSPTIVVAAQTGCPGSCMTDTMFTGTVTLTISGCGASLTGGATQALSSGVATFTGRGVTGTGTACNFTATVANANAGVSNSFDVTGGGCTPDHLTFTSQPSNANFGQSLGTIAVTVKDSGGTTCTSATNLVTLSNHAGTCTGMTISGTTSGNASSGVYSTSGVSESGSTPGACSIDANSSGLTGATSNPFNLTVSNGHRGRMFIRK